MQQSAQIESYLQKHLTDYLEMLRQMVAINSFTANPVGINALGERTAEIFSTLGFQAEFVQSANPEYGRHLVLTRSGTSGRTIGMVSHLDTVFSAEEEVRNNFHWRVEGDRIYGPGTVDIKGGTVMMYMVLDAIREFVPALYEEMTWVLLLDASEETDGTDFGDLCKARLAGEQTLGCLIFEGGTFRDRQFQVVVARKGMAMFDIEVAGRAAHAGVAHMQGVNAIVQLADTIQKAAAVTDYEREITVNVGLVEGGTVTNRVPHEAMARLEMRAFTPEAYETAVSQILALAGPGTISSAADAFPAQVNITWTRRTQPWPRNDATDQLCGIWQEAGAELGYTVLPEERGGLSDGNYFVDQIPTLDGLGPSGGSAHCSEQSEDGSKQQEHCYISSFVPKAMLNINGILKLASA